MKKKQSGEDEDEDEDEEENVEGYGNGYLTLQKNLIDLCHLVQAIKMVGSLMNSRVKDELRETASGRSLVVALILVGTMGTLLFVDC